jgi:hypothetical protein
MRKVVGATATQDGFGTKRGRTRHVTNIVLATPWPACSSQTETPTGLTDHLRCRLCQVGLDNGKTFSQELIDAWIGEALGGNFRALQEIIERIDGASSRASNASAPPTIDEHMAGKILEILCDPNDDLPSD